jgi:D-aminopeptidase
MMNISCLIKEFHGCGGCVAIIHKGNLIAKDVWGFSNLKHHIPMTNKTLFPICSLTKQFISSLILGENQDILQNIFDHQFPNLSQQGIKIHHLLNNQSGIRDYWALSFLLGTKPEDVFKLEDSMNLISKMKTLQFKPGSEYSYSNTNFYILARLLEILHPISIDELLKKKLFEYAHMESASFIEDTSIYSNHCCGYEGNVYDGYKEAINRIFWLGDAGILASLDDMVQWESFIQKTSYDNFGIYNNLSMIQYFNDGKRSSYGRGLTFIDMKDVLCTGHAGAIRGFRIQRIYSKEHQLSVVVMLNHEADAYVLAEKLLNYSINHLFSNESIKPITKEAHLLNIPNYLEGSYFNVETGLSLLLTRLDKDSEHVILNFAGYPELMSSSVEHELRSSDLLTTCLFYEYPIIQMFRKEDNSSLNFNLLNSFEWDSDFIGSFYCEELHSSLYLKGNENVLYGWFEGALGQGEVNMLEPLGEDTFLMHCPRGLDSPAPGYWTLHFLRDSFGKINECSFSCWLARKLTFKKN